MAEPSIRLVVRKGGEEWRFTVAENASIESKAVMIVESQKTLRAAGLTSAELFRVGLGLMATAERLRAAGPGAPEGQETVVDLDAPKGTFEPEVTP